MHTALRSYVTAGVALAGAGMIAATPTVTPPQLVAALPDIQLTAGTDLDLLGPWVDAFNTASVAATRVADFAFEAPAAALQQVLVNQVGYLGDVLNDPASIGDVFSTIGGNLQDVFAAATFLGDPFPYMGSPLMYVLANTVDLQHFTMLAGVNGLVPGTPEVPAAIVQLLNFAASPLSGVLLGAVGPFASPLVEIGNTIGTVFEDLTGGAGIGQALTDLLDAPANVVGSIFNGASLDLSAVLPLIEDSMPPGMAFPSLGLELGGLFSSGSVMGPLGEGGSVGGSILNALSFGPVEGHAIGPIGALANFSQIIASTLGWDGVGNPLTDLVFPTLDFGDMFSTAALPGLDLAGLLDGLGGNLGDLLGFATNIPQMLIDLLMSSF